MASKKNKKRQTKRATIAAHAAADETHGKKVKAVPAGRSTVAGCLCRNAYQDAVHGFGRRVFNLGPAGASTRPMTCTSCGARRSQTASGRGRGEAA